MLLHSRLKLILYVVDVDECTASSPVCHVNATCNNAIGSYQCTCKPGYAGDGKTCRGKTTRWSSIWQTFSTSKKGVTEIYTCRVRGSYRKRFGILRHCNDLYLYFVSIFIFLIFLTEFLLFLTVSNSFFSCNPLNLFFLFSSLPLSLSPPLSFRFPYPVGLQREVGLRIDQHMYIALSICNGFLSFYETCLLFPCSFLFIYLFIYLILQMFSCSFCYPYIVVAQVVLRKKKGSLTA